MDNLQSPSALPAPVKNSRLTAMLLAAACAGLMATPAKAGSIYDESTSSPGDTSNVFSSPTQLPDGTTKFIGTLGFSGDGFDNFIIPLPNTGAPTNLQIDYTLANAVSSSISFSGTSTSTLASRFTPPINSGSFLLNIPAGQSLLVRAQVEGGTQSYTINVTNLSAVPLPNPAALGAAGLLGLGAWGLLNKRAKSATA